MRRTISLLTAVAAVVATMMASTRLAVAQGNPRAVEGAILFPACELGQGETSGTRKPADPDEPVFGAVQGAEFGTGGITCSVPLPVEAGTEFLGYKSTEAR